MVWAGANDFFVALNTGMSPAVLIGNGVNHTVTAVLRLWEMGARHILVLNVPDMGVTPYARSIGQSEPVTRLAAAYDQALDLALDQLAQEGIETIRFDVFSILHELALNPADYGFTDVATPLIYAGPVDNPDEYLFWDPVHPTTRTHLVLADAVLHQLISAFSPSHGRNTPNAMANGLRGLVNAAGQN